MNALGKKINFHDFQPELESFREAVLEGLSRKPKQIPPKFFYDKTVQSFLKLFSNNRNITFPTLKEH